MVIYLWPEKYSNVFHLPNSNQSFTETNLSEMNYSFCTQLVYKQSAQRSHSSSRSPRALQSHGPTLAFWKLQYAFPPHFYWFLFPNMVAFTPWLGTPLFKTHFTFPHLQNLFLLYSKSITSLSTSFYFPVLLYTNLQNGILKGLPHKVARMKWVN